MVVCTVVFIFPSKKSERNISVKRDAEYNHIENQPMVYTYDLRGS